MLCSGQGQPDAIKAYYQGENSEAFDASGKLLDAYKTKFENELKRLEIDKKPAYDQFKSDSTAWINAYVAYVAALKAYNNYKGTNTYQAITKEVTTYNSLKAEDKKLETANALRTSILGYLGKRKAVDGFNAEFATTYKDALTDANLATFNEAIATAVSDGISSLIGNETLATSFNDKVEGSTLFAFLEANQALFGGSELNLEKSIEPKEISANKYDMPKNVSQLIDNPENNSGSFVKYTYLAQESNYLVNLDKWQALYAKIKAEADPVLAEVDAINEKIATL